MQPSNQQCRICGAHQADDKDICHIFKDKDRNVSVKISACLPIVITENDPYSKLICVNCASQLDKFYNFQEISKETDRNLKNNEINTKQEPSDGEGVLSGHQELMFCEPLQSIKEEATTSDVECGLNQKNDKDVTDKNDIKSNPKLDMNVVFKCSYCNKKFSSFGISEAHIKEKHQREREARLAVKSKAQLPKIPAQTAVQTKTTTMFRCTYCSLMFTTREATAKHVLETHKKEREKRFALSEIKQNTKPTVEPSTSNSEVPYCSKETRPLTPTADITVYRCKYCNILCASLEVIREHVEKNHKVPNIKCNHCTLSFMSKGELIDHVKKHHTSEGNIKKIKCDYCKSRFDTNEELKVHEQSCWVPKLKKYKKNIICNFCSASYSDTKSLESHMLRCHICLLCDKIYYTGALNSLRYHKKTHELGLESRKNNICSICGAKFMQKKSLVVHTRKHTGERPYECNLCPKKYTSQQGLRKHLFLHTGIKLFKCYECGKSFACAEYLKVHALTHTGERPFMCDVCGKCYTQQSSLIGHRRLHNINMKCDECGHVSKTRTLLLKHMKSHL